MPEFSFELSRFEASFIKTKHLLILWLWGSGRRLLCNAIAHFLAEGLEQADKLAFLAKRDGRIFRNWHSLHPLLSPSVYRSQDEISSFILLDIAPPATGHTAPSGSSSVR